MERAMDQPGVLACKPCTDVISVIWEKAEIETWGLNRSGRFVDSAYNILAELEITAEELF